MSSEVARGAWIPLGPWQRAGVLTALGRKRTSAGGPCRCVVAASAASRRALAWLRPPTPCCADRRRPQPAAECICTLALLKAPPPSAHPTCTQRSPEVGWAWQGPGRGGGRTLRTCGCPAPHVFPSPLCAAPAPRRRDLIRRGTWGRGRGGAEPSALAAAAPLFPAAGETEACGGRMRAARQRVRVRVQAAVRAGRHPPVPRPPPRGRGCEVTQVRGDAGPVCIQSPRSPLLSRQTPLMASPSY